MKPIFNMLNDKKFPCFLVGAEPQKEAKRGPSSKLAMQADLSDVLSRELDQMELCVLEKEAFRTLSLCPDDPDRSWFVCQMLVGLIKNGTLEVTAEDATKFLGCVLSLEKTKSTSLSWQILYSYSLLIKKLIPFCSSKLLPLLTLERLFALVVDASTRVGEKHTPFLVEATILSACRKVLLSPQPTEPDVLATCFRILYSLPQLPAGVDTESDCVLLGEVYPMYRIMSRKAITLASAIALSDTPDGAFTAALSALPFLQCSPIDICIEEDKDVVNLLSDSLGLWHKFGSCGETSPSPFDPFALFAKFSRLIFFDSNVLRDFIIETKGTFLVFLVKFFKVCAESPERITSEFAGDGDSFALFIQMLSALKECEFDFNATPLRRRIDALIRTISTQSK